MKYKVLLMTLLSTLAIPYGTTVAMDNCGRDAGRGNPQREATEREIAEHEEKAQRIAEQEMAHYPQLITLVNCNLKVGGLNTVDLDQKFQTITEGIEIQKVSLGNSLNNLTIMLADIPGIDLATKLAYLTQEINKDKVTNEALRREIEARKLEQAETKALLADILQQQQSIVHQPPLPPETQLSSQLAIVSPILTTEIPTNSLSVYQQELLSRRNQIGEEAWKLLGGENESLAAILLGSIQQNQGIVEILSLARNNFTLRINGKVQDQIYKF